jgi:hypothetical protein
MTDTKKTDCFEIIDNFLDNKFFDRIYTNVVLSHHHIWRFSPYLNINHTTIDNDCYFESLIFQDKQIYLDNYRLFEPFWTLLNIKELLRIKANCYPSKEKLIVHSPHVDYPFAHRGAILYLNTCDGFTKLSNGTTVDSVRNRLLLFNAGEKHQSTNCTNCKARFNINFNFFSKDD